MREDLRSILVVLVGSALILGVVIGAGEKWGQAIRRAHGNKHHHVATRTCRLLGRSTDDHCIDLVREALAEVDPE